MGNYNSNSEKQLLQIGVNQQKLTTKESQLLRLLCVHKKYTDRSFALKSIWQDDNYFNGRSMDVYIAKLQKCLRDDSRTGNHQYSPEKDLNSL